MCSSRICRITWPRTAGGWWGRRGRRGQPSREALCRRHGLLDPAFGQRLLAHRGQLLLECVRIVSPDDARVVLGAVRVAAELIADRGRPEFEMEAVSVAAERHEDAKALREAHR